MARKLVIVPPARRLLTSRGMAITQQMVMLRMEDIAAFAEARALVRLVRDLGEAARRAEAKQLLATLHVPAVGVAASLAEALRAAEPHLELRRLRDATLALGELRAQAWDALGCGALTTARFDDIMTASARCRREIDLLEAAVRRRARRHLDTVD